LEKIFFNTIGQRILRLMAKYPEKNFYESERAQSADISVGGANQTLRELVKANLVDKEIKGRMSFHRINLKNPLVRQLKIINNLVFIQPLVDRLKTSAFKITLFGSSATGDNLSDSDIDLFIISNNPEIILQTTKKGSFKNRIQAIVKDPVEAEQMRKENPTLYEEIDRGIVIYEAEDESGT